MKWYSKIWQMLYPNGRAFIRSDSSNRAIIHDSIGVVNKDVVSQFESLKIGMIPDNNKITLEEVELLEYKYGIYFVEGLTLEQRKTRLLYRMAYPNGIIYRQSAYYMEWVLRNHGFDVRVSENLDRFPPADIIGLSELRHSNNTLHGASTHGGVKYNLIANNMQEGEFFSLGGNIWATFFIKLNSELGARKTEFRELVLKLKPAHLVALIIGTSEGLGDFNNDFNDDFNNGL